ncbi:MAG: hypothetical protein NC121_16715 [Blautia sp.]|nr:hypothetical protein [Blautia sp.]
MKRCANCNKNYEDSKAFCPGCGGALIPVANTFAENTKAAPTSGGNSGSSGQAGTSAESPWYFQWAGTILAVVGLIIEWELSAIFGAALTIVGFILAKDSPIQTNKIVATVLLVIGIVLLIITYI